VDTFNAARVCSCRSTYRPNAYRDAGETVVLAGGLTIGLARGRGWTTGGGATGKLFTLIGGLLATGRAVAVTAAGGEAGDGSAGAEISRAVGRAATAPTDSGGVVRAKNKAMPANASAASARACTSEKDRRPAASGRRVLERAMPDRVSRGRSLSWAGGSGQGTRASRSVSSPSPISTLGAERRGGGG